MTQQGKTWSRRRSAFEDAAVRVLKDSRRPLSLKEVATRMVDRGLVEVRGKTPEKSLYGLIYRKDKARQERGQLPIFKKIRKGSSVLYTLNK